MSKFKILDLTPVGRYADGSYFYKFHNPFPSSGFTKLPENFNTPEEAFEHGKTYVANYERNTFPGGMGECLGVVNDNDSYQAVIATYYSNT
jgi:hypothetical protein